MNPKPLMQASLAEHCAGASPSTRKQVRERAVEVAALHGRNSQQVVKSDWEQAKDEASGSSSDFTGPTQEHILPLIQQETEAIPSSNPLYDLIQQQPFFKGLKSKHLQTLTNSAMELQFESGQLILEEGSPANRFYLILAGKVALESQRKQEGDLIQIQTLGPGEDLGWSWLFPPYYMRLTARTLEPTKTIFFYGTRLREACEQDHDLGYELMKRIAEVMIERLSATQQRLIDIHESRTTSPP